MAHLRFIDESRATSANYGYTSHNPLDLNDENVSSSGTVLTPNIEPLSYSTPVAGSPTSPENAQAVAVAPNTQETSPYTPGLPFYHSPPQTRSIFLSVNSPRADSHVSDTLLQTILIRYYTENLAAWFDLNDPLRHFTMVVPLRSRHSRPLLSAILTASARQLIRARHYRNAAGAVEWQGHILSNLNEELALKFQNECIRELLDSSLDPDKVMSPDLLAAAIILRTDEEMDALFRPDGADDQVFLGVAHAYIDAQFTTVVSPIGDMESPTVISSASAAAETSSSSAISTITPSRRPRSREWGDDNAPAQDDFYKNLRQACFWAACRQDVHASLIKQRPINFPLPHCNAQRTLTPAQDHVWTVRTIVFCADVLEFCYGRRNCRTEIPPAYTNYERWKALEQRHADISARLPSTFEPTYTCEPKLEAGEAFPQIWFQDACHATGIGHLELARMLLTVFNPSIPRLGLGYLTAQREIDKTLRTIVLKLCGIAISNSNAPPNFINAFTALLLCGEHFDDQREQVAILRLLELMQRHFAYYTERVVDRLKIAWQRQSANTTSPKR